MKMKWFVRSSVIAALAFAAPTPADLLYAQGAKSQSASAVIEEAEDASVVVVGLAPVDTMLPNVQHLARLIAGGGGAGTVATLIKQYTGGLDTARPAGVFVELDESGTPSPIACLPLRNLDEFFQQLVIFGEPEDLGDGLYSFNIGNSIYLRKVEGWLVVGQSEDAVLNFDTTVAENLKGMVAKYDLRVQVNPQNIPDELLQFFMSQMQAGIEQGMASNPNMSEEQAEAARANAEQMMASFQEGIEGTEKFVIGLAVNKADKKTMLDVGTKFVEGSKFATQIEKVKGSMATLAGIPQDASMMSAQSLQLIAPEEVKQLEDTMSSSIEAAFKQIEENAKNPEDAAKAKDFINRLVELVMDSAREGKMESALNITVEKNLNAVGSFTVADGKKVEALAAEASKALATEKDVPVKLQVNTGKHAGANLHKLTVPLPPEADDSARKVFGDQVTVAIATTPKAVHLALGKDCDTVIKSTIDRVTAKPSSPAEMVKARFNLTQLLTYIQSIKSNPVVDAMLETASGGADKVMVDSKVGDRESVVRITFEDNVIKAISSGAKAAQGGGQGGF
ncbi:hypothetical protein VN12_17405 [Pirellula sp. SH-Sr6A]|uniref:hypothetical protein n=1 Tax=Pirellula sp. SH-Sr6A TaxID=1632865 RepID=UPI00078E22BB|nr:hypothetical protein [Pirellula sp. SH-Sr6A]AMV33910.1 hypothetical protein VN12_17405 [Pirellula sp. SH-Sr6A]